MRSKLLVSAVVASTIAGGATLAAAGIAGAQSGGDRPPAEAGKPGGRGPKLDAAATPLNLSVDDLRSKLQSGKTLAQVAQDQNVDVQKVIDAMVADATAHIDQAVQDGKLTADQANERKSELNDRITKLVNEGPPERGEGPRGRGEGPPRERNE
jgi:ribosomal protein S20